MTAFRTDRRSRLRSEGGYRLLPMLDVAPTQVTVGLREVDHKRRLWREKSGAEAAACLADRPVPVVLGPARRCHMIDRHHFVRAMYEEGLRHVPVVVIADMSSLAADEFWRTLEERAWAHPIDEAGRRRRGKDMPGTVLDLRDDVYRSLAGALRRSGGFAKSDAPFSEFRWAHFLRDRIPKAVVEADFDRALARALDLSRDVASMSLPGSHHAPAAVDAPGAARSRRVRSAATPPPAAHATSAKGRSKHMSIG